MVSLLLTSFVVSTESSPITKTSLTPEAVEDDSKLLTLLPPPPKYQDYRPGESGLASTSVFVVNMAPGPSHLKTRRGVGGRSVLLGTRAECPFNGLVYTEAASCFGF